MSYLVVGSIFSVGTSVLWCLWSRFERTLQSCIFQIVASRFDLSYHHLRNVTNIVTITRILERLQLRTHTYLWQHEVNVDSDDSIMTGYIRLPVHAWFLWVLSLLGISHYIWISDRANEIIAVGQTEFLHALFRVSNMCANCAVPEEELEALRVLLRPSSPRTGAENRCVQCERFVSLVLQFVLLFIIALASQQFFILAFWPVSVFVSAHWWWRGTLRHQRSKLTSVVAKFYCFMSMILQLIFFIFVALASQQNFVLVLFPVCALWFAYLWYQEAFGRCSSHVTPCVSTLWCKLHGGMQHVWRREIEQNTVEEELLLETFLPDSAKESETLADVPTPEQESAAIADMDVDLSHYCLVVVRGNWFDGSFRRKRPALAEQGSTDSRHRLAGCRAFAMPLCQDMPHHVAATLQTDCVLYVCIHNPMIECPMIEMQELIKKASRTVALAVILPPIEELDAALSAGALSRIRGNNETKYVATYCDWSSWLMTMTSGIFQDIALVIPYTSSACLSHSQAWKCVHRITDHVTIADVEL